MELRNLVIKDISDLEDYDNLFCLITRLLITMARKGNLMTAIDIYRRKDYEGQRQKSMQKKAAKRKRDKALQHMEALSTLSRGAAENKVGIDRPCDFQEAGSDVKVYWMNAAPFPSMYFDSHI